MVLPAATDVGGLVKVTARSFVVGVAVPTVFVPVPVAGVVTLLALTVTWLEIVVPEATVAVTVKLAVAPAARLVSAAVIVPAAFAGAVVQPVPLVNETNVRPVGSGSVSFTS